MSRYASKAELISVIKSTAATDHMKLGTPKGANAFNMSQLVRDSKITGDSYYGWTLGVDEQEFAKAIRAAVRPVMQKRWDEAQKVKENA